MSAKPVLHNQKISDAQLIADFPVMGAEGVAEKYGMLVRNVYARRKAVERDHNIQILAPTRGATTITFDNHPAAVTVSIQNGHILIGSDSHYWPGIVTTAHRAFLECAKEFKPKVIIKNGDEADFPSISRHAPIAWERRPKVAEEIENLKAMLSEIEKVAPNARRIWPLGNHDSRFETRLATVAPEYAEVNGVHLKDNFPKWEPCWAAFVNGDTVVKHRMRGGMHATRNNALNAGRTLVTGHLHSLKVTPLSDYNGTRWGVDCGTMADPYGPQFFNYTELNPLDWRSGFILLTFVNGRLLWPEQIWVSGKNTVQFRGKEWSV